MWERWAFSEIAYLLIGMIGYSIYLSLAGINRILTILSTSNVKEQ